MTEKTENQPKGIHVVAKPIGPKCNLDCEYCLDKVNEVEGWFMAPVTQRIVEFKKSLVKEPPIRLGTSDPYVPSKR